MLCHCRAVAVSSKRQLGNCSRLTVFCSLSNAMIHDWKMELYWRLPVFLQEAALYCYAGYLDKLYYGDGYRHGAANLGMANVVPCCC